MTNLTATGRHRNPLGWMPSVFGIGLGHAGRRLFDTVTGANRTDYVGRHIAPRIFTRFLTARLVAMAVACAALTVGIAIHGVTTAHADEPVRCGPILVDTIPGGDAQVRDMLAHGYTSNPHDGLEALYVPGCDGLPVGALPEVDTWPLGASAAAPLLGATIDAALTIAYDTVTAAWLVDAGYTPLPAGVITDPDGTPHADCYMLVGDTSLVECTDGYSTTS